MQELMEEREAIRKELNEAVMARKEKGRQKAFAEVNYKRCRTLHMHRIMIDGYETETIGKTKPIAATAAYDFAQGIPEVAKYKLERDVLEAELDSLTEIINIKKLELRIVEADINAIRSGK